MDCTAMKDNYESVDFHAKDISSAAYILASMYDSMEKSPYIWWDEPKTPFKLGLWWVWYNWGPTGALKWYGYENSNLEGQVRCISTNKVWDQ